MPSKTRPTTLEAAYQDFAMNGLANRVRASENTRKFYLLDIRQFLDFAAWLNERPLPSSTQDITLEVVQRFFSYLEREKKLGPASRRRKAASLRVFCKWLLDKGQLKEDFVQKIPLFTVPKKNPRAGETALHGPAPSYPARQE